MSDEINPEEKPSFFDSGEESKSWPPSDNYEIENEPANLVGSNSEQSIFDADDFENPFREESPETITPEEVEPLQGAFQETSSTQDFLDSDDFLDQLIDNVDEKNNINNMRIIDDEVDDDFTTNEELIIEPEPISSEELYSNQQETEASYEQDLNDNLNIENVINENKFQEAVSDDSDDFDLDDLINDDFSSPEKTNQEYSQEEITKEDPFEDSLLSAGLGSAGIAFSDPEGLTDNETSFSSEPDFEDFNAQDYQTQAKFDDSDYAESEFIDIVDHETDTGLKPFRTFTKINLAEELADEKEEEEEAGGVLAGVNRNVLIIIAIIVLSLGYFVFTTFFNRTVETRSRERRRPPKKETISSRAEQVLTPVWEVSSQKTKNPELEDKYAKSLIKFTGRENPFAMPQSVIDALKRQADMALLAKKKPNTFKRMAYRATLLGVLTSEGSTIALVNVQEANFDVIEGTTKNKVLKLATKSMDKAKKNTLEMGRGSFIGPWEIINVAAPSGAFSDAKITVEYSGNQKVLSMGKAEDLGIFDSAGQLDNLESTENEFEDDDFDDDF